MLTAFASCCGVTLTFCKDSMGQTATNTRYTILIARWGSCKVQAGIPLDLRLCCNVCLAHAWLQSCTVGTPLASVFCSHFFMKVLAAAATCPDDLSPMSRNVPHHEPHLGLLTALGFLFCAGILRWILRFWLLLGHGKCLNWVGLNAIMPRPCAMQPAAGPQCAHQI